MCPHTGWGVGKRDRGKDTQTQRQKRKFSGVLLHGDTKLLNESSTLRAHLTLMGFAGGSDGNDLPTMGGTGFYPWVWKIPWRRELQAPPVFLPEKSHGQRSLVGYRPWHAKKLERFSKHSTLAVQL